MLTDHGFSFTWASTCVMRHPECGIEFVRHGDEIVARVDGDGLVRLEVVLESKYEITNMFVGHGGSELKHVKVRNRVIEVTAEGFAYEAGAR